MVLESPWATVANSVRGQEVVASGSSSFITAPDDRDDGGQ